MQSTIIYVHGFNSGPESETAKTIQAAFPNENFICPQLDHSDFQGTKEILCDLINELAIDEDIIVVGSSMGGFWANYLGIKYVLKTVLINPALNPGETLRGLGVDEATCMQYDEFVTYCNPNFSQKRIVVFYGTEDKVIPRSHIDKYYKNPILLQGEGHRLQNMQPVLDMVQRMIGNYPEYQ